MANYLSLTNQVLDNLRWDPISQAEFSAPPDPAPAVKRFINQAKDDVLARIGGRMIEKEFIVETNRAVTDVNSSIDIQASTNGAPTRLEADGALFLDWMVGAKISMPEVPFSQTLDDSGNTIHPTGAGLYDPTWRRITSVLNATTAFVDIEFTTFDTTTISEWTIFRDEYNLNSTVRQVMSAWTNRGPLDLCFVDNVTELETIFPGNVTIGSPERCAIYRSETSGSIWAMRLYPAPEEREVIRYRAKYRLPDLSDYDDFWEIEPEIETMIVDQATMKAVQTPIQNDPELARVLGADVNRRAIEWKMENTPNDPNRRLRRATPGSSGVPQRRARIVTDLA